GRVFLKRAPLHIVSLSSMAAASGCSVEPVARHAKVPTNGSLCQTAVVWRFMETVSPFPGSGHGKEEM
ncbi:hypothetical protein, partial [Shewanella algae]|uniref:hypothetical protein n=1 Tax=Shewanella algae TaxID=38313 RepID=UPI001F2773EB